MGDLAFNDGPFFYISEPIIGSRDATAIVWANDAYAARSAYGMRTNRSVAYIYPELIGSLLDLERDYELTPTQVADLRREGYLELRAVRSRRG